MRAAGTGKIPVHKTAVAATQTNARSSDILFLSLFLVSSLLGDTPVICGWDT